MKNTIFTNKPFDIKDVGDWENLASIVPSPFKIVNIAKTAVVGHALGDIPKGDIVDYLAFGPEAPSKPARTTPPAASPKITKTGTIKWERERNRPHDK
jgi:hypothetical protein